MTQPNRRELAQFLRARRHGLTPHEVGLPATGPRRTPGLRRQEVAQLAGMSIDYYIRLEQGRGPRPSGQILAALARALLLSMDERDYLFRIAGENPLAVRSPSQEVPNAVRILLDTMPHTPAYVLDAKYEVLAWNRLATFFLGDLDQASATERNVLRWIFREEESTRWTDPDAVCFARASVADLRAAYAQYPGDSGIAQLVSDLLATSTRFADIWAAHEVEVRRRVRKRIVHPVGGEMVFESQMMHIPESDQRVIAYCAEPGSPTEAAFQRLAALAATECATPSPADVRYHCVPAPALAETPALDLQQS